MKKEVDHINAVPSKRIFLSIIADYDLNRSICELIDNVLDIWIKSGRRSSIKIDIELEKDQQTVCVIDNAGGVRKSELRFIVSPGQTTNIPTDETIGIFGVGTKRAVIALAQDIKITTRYRKNKTYLVEFDDSWLESEDWELPIYEVENIREGSTVIELQKLRVRVTDEAISNLKEHLQATYARFLLDNRVIIKLGPDKLKPVSFENWAYPPGYSPRKYIGNLETEGGGTVKVEVLAGLNMESSPAGGEYGVYFYCNDRLIARGLKSYDVGFIKGIAGRPHPSISLTRVIVSLNGEAQSMPWNSSKSGINTNHPVFVALRIWLAQSVVKDYTSLSRRLQGDWPKRVFKYPLGKIVEVKIDSFPKAKKSYLPPLPKSKPRYSDLIEQANREIVKDKPWTKGLYETIIAIDLIFKQRLEQKNRICLILLDSTLEIAFKEFLVNDSGKTYRDQELLRLFNNRSLVHDEIKKYTKLGNLWKKIEHYYRLRCKLLHERATVGIDDSQIEDFREVVQTVLNKLFKLRFWREQT